MRNDQNPHEDRQVPRAGASGLKPEPAFAPEPLDILGRVILPGSMVLWGRHGSKSGFAHDAPLRVVKITKTRVSLSPPDGGRTTAAPHKSVVVIDLLLPTP